MAQWSTLHSIKHKRSVHKAGRAHGAITRRALQPISRAAWDLGKMHGGDEITFSHFWSQCCYLNQRQTDPLSRTSRSWGYSQDERVHLSHSQLQQPVLTQSWCWTANKITFVSTVSLDNYLTVNIRKSWWEWSTKFGFSKNILWSYFG